MTTLSSNPLAPVAGPTGGDARGRAPRAGAPAAAPADGARPADAAEVKQAAARANAELRQRASELAFEFEDDIAKVVVKLIDKGTGEVIRQFPSEEMLRIARALSKEQHVGALLRADA